LEDAVRALSLYATDALDPNFQSEKTFYKGMHRKVEMRPETLELMEKSLSMVKANLSEEAYNLFGTALKAKIAIEEVPCLDFEDKRTAAIDKLSQ
jgi:hypothetical protein